MLKRLNITKFQCKLSRAVYWLRYCSRCYDPFLFIWMSSNRPGRRPKGFLSFISSKSTQGPPAAHRGAKPGPQKPAVNTTRPERKQIAAGPVTNATDPGVKRPSPTPASTAASVIEVSYAQIFLYFYGHFVYSINKTGFDLSTHQISDEEPTSVSKYFFSDIFTEVDEIEDME